MKSVLIKDDFAQVSDSEGKVISAKKIKFADLSVVVPAWRKMGYPIFIAVCDGLAVYIGPREENLPPSQAEMDCQARLALHHGPCHFSFSPSGASILTWKVENDAPKPQLTPAQDRLLAKAKARAPIKEVRANLRAQKGKEPKAADYPVDNGDTYYDPEDKVLYAGQWVEPEHAAFQKRIDDLHDGIADDD